MEDRINELLSYLQLSSAQFADIIGVQRSSISHILSGRNKPSFDFINKILLKYPKINANWLIAGIGVMLVNDNTLLKDESIKNSDNLFSNKPETPYKPKENTSFLLEKKQKIIEKEVQNDNTKIGDIISEVTNVNKVKCIVLIYEDDTFKILNSK